MRSIGLILALVFGLMLSVPSASAQDPVPDCPASGGAIHVEGFVTFGGIEQWVTIHGENCANPILLMVHGGPGNPLSPFSRNLYGDWEKDFTIVQWDQRGSGMTFGRNRPSEDTPLTVEQLRDDGLELAGHLTKRLGQPKVILIGGSWGSVLAVEMVKARPELFHAYLGASQLVNSQANLKAAYDGVLNLAQAASDTDSVNQLQTLGAPPWTNPRNVGMLRRIARRYEAARIDPSPQAWWTFTPAYTTPEAQADYEAGEEYSFLQYVGLKGDGMAADIDLPALGQRFEVPVFIVHGEEDLWTVPEVARQYFDLIDAPTKAFLTVPRTGHDPNAALVAAQWHVLTHQIAPLTR